ncbi:branched-chain amino acid ABC transporter permease [Actinotalea sp. Marseille-Q4924]|uniref:branched-chain amino acid ABC transporter permease n=1 Tax=Actinotalea sp. Marseille-Q4924 TaxID=2866571 RepID=UPI001CE41F12|nr:branched-chain amino acid ABC transporter permease [Actinotalea sp. Marseille-Q4924]
MIAGLLLLLGTLLTVLAPPATAAVTSCSPTPTTACLNGTIRTAAGEPAVGVELSVTGPEETTAVTGEDGRWFAEVATAGTYEVAVDEATLPEGESLRDPAANPRAVTVTLGSSAGALFPLGEPSAPSGPTAPPAEGGTDDPAAPPAAGGGEPGLDTPTQGGSGGSSITWARVAQQAMAGLVFGTLLALASVGLSLIFGTTGLSNFAHGEMVTLGGLAAFVFVQVVGLPLVPAVVLAVAVGALAGWVQDAGMWKPLRKRRVGLTQQLIVTIGLAITAQYVFQFFFGGGSLRIVTANPSTVNLGPVFITTQSLVGLVVGLLVLGGVAYFLVGTRTGRATRAVSDNPALAAASGIAVDRIIRLVWTIGGALAALGGVFLGLYFNATAWNMGATILLLMFAAVTLGGLGTAFGALVGSLVIGLVVEMSNLVIPSDMRYAGALVILILVLLLRPQGILGRAERIG